MRLFAAVLAAVLSFGLGWLSRGAAAPTPITGAAAGAPASRAAPGAPSGAAADVGGHAASGTVPTDAAGGPPASVKVGPDGRIVPSPNPQAPFIEVRAARYGNGERWADVTEACQEMVRGETLTLPVNLHHPFKVDPSPGFMKYCEMVVAVNGVEVNLAVADSLHLTTLRLSSPAEAANADPPPDKAQPGKGGPP